MVLRKNPSQIKHMRPEPSVREPEASSEAGPERPGAEGAESG
jgi:hypothetical protein